MKETDKNKSKAIKTASILGVLGNLLLLIIKGTVGFTTHSRSMIADTFNSAGDVFSSVMTFIGNKIASKPKDEDHNLGHGKAEYIYSMLISIAMLLMGFEVLGNSLKSLIEKTNYDFSIWLIIVCIVTIITKLFLYIYTNKLYKKYNNLLLEANAKDHRNDCLITVLNLVACLCSQIGLYIIDGIVGTIISIWIMISAIQIFIKSYDVLMDKSLDDKTLKKVRNIIARHKEIKRVTHLNSTPVGYRYQISFTIYVNGNLTTFESHEIADNLEKEIDKELPEIYLTVIHVNPIEIKKKGGKICQQ